MTASFYIAFWSRFVLARLSKSIWMIGPIRVASYLAKCPMATRFTAYGRIMRKVVGPVLVTVYRPDPDVWIDWRRRKDEDDEPD